MKKYTLYFLSLILTFSCSKEESNSNKQENETFLQRVNGIGFVDSNDEAYFYFYNSKQFLRFFEVEGDNQYTYCQVWSEATAVIFDETIEIEILSNTFQSLLVELRWEYDGNFGSESYEFKLNETETILTVIYSGDENETSVYRKTGKEISDFECDESISV